MSMTLWALEQALVTNTAQDAVEAVYKAAPSLVTYADERHEVNEALTKLCELLCLEDDFLEESEE
jgi:hypothetical protein